jgi:MFS family permease
MPEPVVTVPPKRGASPRAVSLIVASAMFMEQLDGTVLATALPTMARSFNADPLQMNVALTSYLLTLAMFIPASGRLADRFGSRTVFRAAIGMFTLGSIACAQAPSLAFLVAARMLQGAGGAMMSPVGRLVMLRAVSKTDLVKAMAWLMIPATIGPIVGPPVGGFIVTYLSWHWIFYINVPIGIAGILLVTRYIEDIKEPTRTPFDLRGLLLAGTALASLMFSIELASRGVGSSAVAPGLFGLGAVAAALYVPHARHHPRPMLDFRMLRIPLFRDLRLAVARCGGRDAILAADDVAIGLRPVGGAQRVDHLCQFGRLDGDAAYRAAFLAPSWLSQRVHLGRADRHAVACIDRCIPAELADRGDLSRAVAQRVFPVAAIHGL